MCAVHARLRTARLPCVVLVITLSADKCGSGGTGSVINFVAQ